MQIKSLLAIPFAKYIVSQNNKWSLHAEHTQAAELKKLLKVLANTTFGKDHNITGNEDFVSFRSKVPIRDYESLKPWIDKVIEGEKDVLWKGIPIYLSKTSGTTSGVKYIPITQESIHNHITSARNALLSYIADTGNASFLEGNLIFLSGSPALDKKNGILTGRLSGIVNHHVPSYLRRSQLPDFKTNCIEDWEEKVDAIARLTVNKDMRLISGIPPWVQMYFDTLLKISGKQKIMDVFRNFSLFVYGGVNYEPYRAGIEETIGKKVDTLETYPASEGFIAYQNTVAEKGLLMVLNDGIYYEFIPVDEFFNENPQRLSVAEVKIGVNYALIMNTNAGLWGYSIGDTVKFVSLNPHKIVVTGRIKHFISAFGEHVIGEEVEKAMQAAVQKFGARVVEFTVAPNVTPVEGGMPHHQWWVEFEREPDNIESFALALDESMQKQNIYYKDLITGNILSPLKLVPLPAGTFIRYMKSLGKLGGQNKVPRLSNDRQIAEALFAIKNTEG